MNRTSPVSYRRAFALSSALVFAVAGCELIVDFDRTKIDAGSVDASIADVVQIDAPIVPDSGNDAANDAATDAPVSDAPTDGDTGAGDAAIDAPIDSPVDAPVDAADASDDASDDAPAVD